ncbi:MAG: YceI family protein [Thermoanaerobaculia bacterium]|nr:YceI family protein [Thermoanaerobaculia bacterium]
MNKRLILVPLMVLAAISAGPLPTRAAQQALTFDPDASEVGFDLEATGENVHGLFHLQSGEIVFDTETGAASGEVVVEAFGAETGNKKRDKKMHSKVLESERHPLIVFRPESIEGDLAPEGESEILLHGTMELLGSEHPVTMTAAVEVHGDHLTATTTLDVPFIEWGLHDPSFLILKVAKIVNVGITAEGTLETVGGDALASTGR